MTHVRENIRRENSKRESFKREILSPSLKHTLGLAAELGAALEGGETLALLGPLGSGKTTFTKGLCQGLGLVDSRLVSSPTYVLEHVYPARFLVHHYDAYRLSSVDEFVALGFEEHLKGGSVLVIEWADKVFEVLPESSLLVELSVPEGDPGGDTRKIIFSGPSEIWLRKLERLSSKVGASSDR